MFNQIHQVDSYLIWQKHSLKAVDHSDNSWLRSWRRQVPRCWFTFLMEETVPTKRSVSPGFQKKTNPLTKPPVPFFFVLCALLALQMDPHPPPSSLSSIQILVIRCSAGSDDQAHCTASRQELIEREGGIWGSNPEKNPFHDYFKVNPFESVCCTLKKTIEDANPTL